MPSVTATTMELASVIRVFKKHLVYDNSMSNTDIRYQYADHLLKLTFKKTIAPNFRH